jgi:hypothetical protein
MLFLVAIGKGIYTMMIEKVKGGGGERERRLMIVDRKCCEKTLISGGSFKD